MYGSLPISISDFASLAVRGHQELLRYREERKNRSSVLLQSLFRGL